MKSLPFSLPTAGRPALSIHLLGLCAAGCLFALLAGIAPLIAWGGVAGAVVLFWCFTNPINGLALVVALSALFVRSSEDITPQEIAYVILFATVILGWTARRLAAGQPFALSSTDRILVWFIILCICSIIPAFFYGNSLLKWLRELVPFLMFIPYFLIVTLLRQPSDIHKFLVAFVMLSFSMGVINFIDYWINVVDAQQLWELIAGRSAPGEPLFFITLTIALVFIAFEGFRGWRTAGYLAIIVFSMVALAITFSRGYWVAALIALFSSFILMPPRRRWVIFKYSAGLGIVTLIGVTMLMGDLVADIVAVMAERFGSILTAALDLSIRNRLVESAEVWSHIADNPIFGYGLGYYYSFVPLIPYEMPTWYVHNAYLFLWLKLGILGLMMFLIWYVTALIHGYRLYRATTDPFLQPLALGIISIMIAMIPLSVTSPQFIQKDSILFLALGTGIIEYAYRDRAISGRRRTS